MRIRVVEIEDHDLTSWSPEQQAWWRAHRGKEVTGKMIDYDVFQPAGRSPVVLYEEEYEVIEPDVNPVNDPKLREVILIKLRSMGPCTFGEICTEVRVQYVGSAQEHEIAIVLTGLIRERLAALYDDGKSFDCDEPHPAHPHKTKPRV